MKKILIVDDEKNIRKGLKEAVEMEGYLGEEAANGLEALSILKKEKIDAILSDLKMPTMDGHELMSQVVNLYPHIPFIIITGHGDVQDAVKSMQKGAFDFITKPIELNYLFDVLKKALNDKKDKIKVEGQIKKENNTPFIKKTTFKNEEISYELYYSHSKVMKELLQAIKIIAPSSATIAINSEMGNETDYIAQTIYFFSKRREKPFFKVDCASLSPFSMEEDLFGKETSQKEIKKGRLELAREGTIYWENLEKLNPLSQSKLLNLIKSKMIERIGSLETIEINIRFIFHNSENLKKAVEEKNFREDLYDLMKVLEIEVPPLRKRKEDIPFLGERILKKISLRNNTTMKHLSLKAVKKLQNYPFPKNLEEFEKLLEQLYTLCESNIIEEKELPSNIRFSKDSHREEGFFIPFGISWQEIEKKVIESYLKKYPNKSNASRILGISRKTLYKKIEDYKLKED